jgi:hypothetical protein
MRSRAADSGPLSTATTNSFSSACRFPNRSTIVAGAYDTIGKRAALDFTYAQTRSQSSSIEVGVFNKDNTITGDGSVSVSTGETDSQGFAQASASKLFRTEFNIHKVRFDLIMASGVVKEAAVATKLRRPAGPAVM